MIKLKTNDLSACVIYSTHEPCIMYSYAIRFYKIKKVVYQHAVNYLGGVSSAMPLLKSKEVPPHWGCIPDIVLLRVFKRLKFILEIICVKRREKFIFLNNYKLQF